MPRREGGSTVPVLTAGEILGFVPARAQVSAPTRSSARTPLACLIEDLPQPCSRFRPERMKTTAFARKG
jgi:hypothetical protein